VKHHKSCLMNVLTSLINTIIKKNEMRKNKTKFKFSRIISKQKYAGITKIQDIVRSEQSANSSTLIQQLYTLMFLLLK